MEQLKSGDKVVHPMFGPGVVGAVSGSGPDAKITVDFAPAIGRKKLLAGVANLRLSGESNDSDDAPVSAWYEALDVEARPIKGRWIERERLVEAIRIEAHLPRFWMAVRDALRAKGTMPKVLDEPDRRVSLTISGLLKLQIRVRHESLNDARESACAAVMFEILKNSFLRDFENFREQKNAGVDFKLIESGIIEMDPVEEPVALPDRAPLVRPKRVTPKGVIKSIPKRRDDY